MNDTIYTDIGFYWILILYFYWNNILKAYKNEMNLEIHDGIKIPNIRLGREDGSSTTIFPQFWNILIKNKNMSVI